MQKTSRGAEYCENIKEHGLIPRNVEKQGLKESARAQKVLNLLFQF